MSDIGKAAESILEVLFSKQIMDEDQLNLFVKTVYRSLIWIFIAFVIAPTTIFITVNYCYLKGWTLIFFVIGQVIIIVISFIYPRLFSRRICPQEFKGLQSEVIKQNNRVIDLFKKSEFNLNSVSWQIASMNKLYNQDFEHSFNFIGKIIQDKNLDYFVKEMTDCATIKIEPLGIISEVFSNKDTKSSRFLCVIALRDFFKRDSRQILEYFYKFYYGTENNFIMRIFTVPIEVAIDGVEISEVMLEEIEKQNLLTALILNSICNIKTYVFFYDNKKENPLSKNFYLKGDYVIGLPFNGKIKGKEVNKNIIYFAVPPVLNPKDRADSNIYKMISTDDKFIIQLFEEDFRRRYNKYVEFNNVNIDAEEGANLIAFNAKSFSFFEKTFGLYNKSEVIKKSLLNIINGNEELVNKVDLWFEP